MPDTRYPGPEQIRRHMLPNGTTLLTYENFASGSVVIEGLLPVGATADPPEQAGLSDFVSDLLLRGTSDYTFAEIYDALESVGASLGFSSGRHVTQFSAHGLPEDVGLVLELLGQALCVPAFPAEQVERVRGQIMTELQMRANNTRQMASLAFMEQLYEGHPYSRPIRGYAETIQAISRDELANFHARHYGPNGMILAVVGAVSAEQALEKVSAVLGGWKNPQQVIPPSVPDMARPPENRFRRVSMPDKVQADIVMGLPGPRRSAGDYLHASLMNTILGVFGMMGRIGKSVREEQGLAYYASSRLAGGLGPSPWSVSAGVAPEAVEQAIASILEEIVRIQQEPVPEEELADSKAYRTGSLPVGLETNSGLADIIVDMELYGLGLDYLQRFPDLINAVTVADVQAAAQKYLSADELVISVAGPDPSVAG